MRLPGEAGTSFFIFGVDLSFPRDGSGSDRSPASFSRSQNVPSSTLDRCPIRTENPCIHWRFTSEGHSSLGKVSRGSEVKPSRRPTARQAGTKETGEARDIFFILPGSARSVGLKKIVKKVTLAPAKIGLEGENSSRQHWMKWAEGREQLR